MSVFTAFKKKFTLTLISSGIICTDLIGLPEFVSGAMENWGLVTYKETYVLYSPSESSTVDMRQIASVISHELSHSWFGNLVTISWWNDLWLNEGMANYLEYKGQNAVNASWNILRRFVIGDLHPAFRSDVGQSAHPVVNDALTSDEITSIFDTITYSKGASIAYMIESMIGENRFRDACISYLNNYQFRNVKTDDFIRHLSPAIQEVTQLSGEQYLYSYLYRNTFPILTVKRGSSSSSSNTLIINQTPYNEVSDSESRGKDNKEDSLYWNIFVTYLLGNNGESAGQEHGNFMLKDNGQQQTVTLSRQIQSDEWFKLNVNSTGYYIVNYQPEDWQLLIKQLSSIASTSTSTSSFTPQDRASLLFDAYQLSNKALVSYDTLFALFDYLQYEDEYLPWSAANSALSGIQSKLQAVESNSIERWNTYITTLVGDVFDAKVDLVSGSDDKLLEQM